MKMKNTYHLLSCLCIAMLSLLTACEKPEKEQPVITLPGEGVVAFNLTGACVAPDIPKENIAITDAEAEVTTLDAIIFKENKLDTCISLKHVNAEYSFKITEGDYSMVLVANGGKEFAGQMENLQTGVSESEVMEQVRLSSTPEEGCGLVMLSKTIDFKVEDEKECKLEPVEMICPLVRIDLLSGVEGFGMAELVVNDAYTEMSLNGRAVKEDKPLTIKGLSSTGTPENPAVNTGVSYLFPNENTEIKLVYFYNETAEISAKMGTDIKGYMIWGFLANREKLLEIKEIKANMNEGYEASFDIPLPEYKIGVALTGDAVEKSPLINAAVPPYDYEFTVSNAYLAFFKNNSLYEFVEGEKYAKNTFQTILYESNTYELIALANLSEELIAELKKLPLESTNKNTFMATVAKQDPGVEGRFLMVTEPEFVGVTSSWTFKKTVAHRMSSRIDIINGVPGMTIEKAVFENRAKNTTLGVASTDSEMLETKEYTGFEGVGSMTEYPVYAGKIYTYNSTSETNKPAITIHYTMNGVKGTKVVNFDDGIAYNKLYSVVLSGEKMEIRLNEENWTTGYDPVVGDKQVVLNASHAINHFAEFNVKSFSGNTVEFCTDNNSYDVSNPAASGQFLWKDGWDESNYSDADGGCWRVPTRDEMTLLFPAHNDYIMSFYQKKASKQISETLPDNLFGSCQGGTGTSYFRNEKINSSYTSPNVIYALRFRGTDQYAAYRYEMVNCDFDANNAYLSIKVKAVDKDDTEMNTGDFATLIYKIIDKISPEYWRENYVEYIIPLAGVNIKDSRGISYGLWMIGDAENNVFSTFMEHKFMAAPEGTYSNIRMVKVK